jgi:Cu2+-exporting ATPase
VLLEEVDKCDIVLVKPGEKIPVDGEITEGESEIDESMITGESKPAGKKLGDEVVGGSINGTGSLKVRVTKTGEESYLSQVVEMVKKAGESKSRVQTQADKAAYGLLIQKRSSFEGAWNIHVLCSIINTILLGNHDE